MMEIRLKSTFLELLFVCLCLLTVFGPANGQTVVKVTEGSEAVLPCSIRPERDIRQDVFDWKKDGQKKVFFYVKGSHYNNDLPGQDELFRGRVSHFPDQLQFSNASIRITDTKPSDSGTYICDYSPDEPSRQTFYIELVVVSAVVRVTEGSEAVLPCFIRPERNITQDVFDWKKDDQKEVFLYVKGKHYNNGREGQDEQFKGRVFHFEDQLQFSNASIRINNTKLSDTGTYSCDFSPDQPSRQTFYIKLVVVSAVVKVKEGREAVLPCFIRPERNITQDVFDWKKDGQKEVFLYVKGKHYNNGREGQDEQFKGRVFHFPDQLQFSNASIRINNTKLSDSGTYSCDYSPDEPTRQTFYIELVVVACPKPHVTLLKQTKDWVMLQCEVRGVSPNHKVELKDSDGNILSAEETHTQSGSSYNIILNATVTKTGNYSCGVTQEDICHHTSEEIPVHFSGPEPTRDTAVEVTTLKSEEGVLLQCSVQGPSPQPEVEWQDSAGNKLPAKEPQVNKTENGYDIILQAVVTKTDNFRCVVTQEEINHQTKAEIYALYKGFPIGWIVAAVFAALFVVVVVGVLYNKHQRILRCIKGPQTGTEKDEKGDPDASDKQELQPRSTDGDRDDQGDPTELDKLEAEPQSV